MSLLPSIPPVKPALYRLDLLGPVDQTLDLSSGTTIHNVRSVTFNPSQTRLFAGEATNGEERKLYYWDLVTAGQLETASYGGFILLGPLENNKQIKGVAFSPDGLNAVFQTGQDRFEYGTLSSAFSGTYTKSGEFNEPGSLPNFETAPFFNDDGTRLYYIASKELKYYTLSTPYIMATRGVSVQVQLTDDDFTGVSIAKSGTRLLNADSYDESITEYSGQPYGWDRVNARIYETGNSNFEDVVQAVYSNDGEDLFLLVPSAGTEPVTLTQQKASR